QDPAGEIGRGGGRGLAAKIDRAAGGTGDGTETKARVAGSEIADRTGNGFKRGGSRIEVHARHALEDRGAGGGARNPDGATVQIERTGRGHDVVAASVGESQGRSV